MSSLLFRFLDTNGDGTGTKNANGSYAAGVEFYIQPPSWECYRLERMIVSITDGGPLSADKYGGLGAALTNGVEVYTANASGTLVDMTDAVPITTNAAWARQCYDLDADTFGSGDDYVSVRWTFSKAGYPVVLDGSKSERFVVKLNDDLTGITSQYFQVQGLASTVST